MEISELPSGDEVSFASDVKAFYDCAVEEADQVPHKLGGVLQGAKVPRIVDNEDLRTAALEVRVGPDDIISSRVGRKVVSVAKAEGYRELNGWISHVLLAHQSNLREVEDANGCFEDEFCLAGSLQTEGHVVASGVVHFRGANLATDSRKLLSQEELEHKVRNCGQCG